MKIDLLHQYAGDMGLEVMVDDLGPHRRGAYLDDHRLILISPRLTVAQTVATLAHEIGHAAFRDRRTSERLEQRADQMGASLAIEAEEYALAESRVGCHPGALASELGVTPRLVLAWRTWWETKGVVSHGLGREAA